MIDDLVKTIRDRKNSSSDNSYTSSLLSDGLSKCIDKLEEEFGELKEALNTKSNEVHEAADLIYHLLVALEAADVKFEDVLNELEKRKFVSVFPSIDKKELSLLIPTKFKIVGRISTVLVNLVTW